MIARVHQEDACQALGVPPEREYAAEGGPAFRDLFALTRSYVRTPATDVLKLIDAAIFNLAIGNADAHGILTHPKCRRSCYDSGHGVSRRVLHRDVLARR